MSEIYRPTWLEINLKNIWKNYQTISQMNSSQSIVPVVKADAYGHGAFEVTQYLYERGVRFFAVSSLEEALEIRPVSADIDIIIMGLITQEGLSKAREKNIIVTIANKDDYALIKAMTHPPRFHLKVDTGMNRLGFKQPGDVRTVVKESENYDYLKLEGIYTHLATADSDYEYALGQIESFKAVLNTLDYIPSCVHVSNSSAALKLSDLTSFTTHARVGLSLYGETLEDDVDFLYQTMTLKTRVMDIKQLNPGEKVGYGITYEANAEERIGILQVGYADGFIRRHQEGQVSVNDSLYPIVGRVCMDQMFIKVDENVSKNDIVVLLGNKKITVDDIAERLQTIPHEVLTSFSKRVPRVYKR